MSEEPQLPPLPAIGEVLGRKDKFVQNVSTVIKCNNCQNKFTRKFNPGDFTFKKVRNEECPNCKSNQDLIIVEIYSEWVDPDDIKKKD